VLVAGGGIGGLALAGALGRRGVAVDVVDNQPEWSIARSGIALQAPALRALAALDLLDAVAAAGFGMTEFRYHDGAGTHRATSELPRLAGPWHTGRVVLIGDAVHAPPPTLAAGAVIALEDAVVLDEMLAAASGDGVEAALAAFTERRWERCRLVVEQCVARTEGIIRPRPDFDVAAFERRIWGALAKPF
jgi:2-polyprenyl-6-methoxyphenol hydroxylase-like FAD-dependent oxidoreductase